MIRRLRIDSVYYRYEEQSVPHFLKSASFCHLWQTVRMIQKKTNFRRTTIAPAKSAVKKHRAAKRKKRARNLRDNPT